MTHLSDTDSDVLADGARPFQHVPAGSEETGPSPQEAPRQQIHHLLQGAPTTPTRPGGCWEKREKEKEEEEQQVTECFHFYSQSSQVEQQLRMSE